MKTFLRFTALLLMLGTSSAFAQSLGVNNNANADSSSISGAGSIAKAIATSDGLSGNYSGNTNSGNTNNGPDLSQAVGAAMAPALTTTLTETCMGSTSVGGGFSGGSFSFGTTWRDSACVRRLDAREIKTFGDIQAAKEIMCDSDLVRAAFKRVGRPCAEDGGVYTTTPEAVAQVVVPVVVVAPVATDVKVHDDQDTTAQKNQAILKAADDAREIMRAKGY